MVGGILPSIPAPEGRGAAPGPTASIPRGPRPRGLARAQTRVPAIPSRPGAASAPTFASHLAPLLVRPLSSPLSVPHGAQVGSGPAVPTPVQGLTAMTGSADTSKPVPRGAGTTVGTKARKVLRGTGQHSAHPAYPLPRPPGSPLGG